MTDKIRAEFEAWMLNDMLRLGIGTLRAEATLARGACENEWRIWQASRLAALEEVKQSLPPLVDSYDTGGDSSCGMGFLDALEAVTGLLDALATDNRHGEKSA